MNAKVIEPLADEQAGRGRRLREWIVIACLLLFLAMAIALLVALHLDRQKQKPLYWDAPQEEKPFYWDGLPPPPPMDFDRK